jgi:hypothetical protein
MKTRLLGCVLLLGTSLSAQTIEKTLLALKDPAAPRKVLSNHLADQILSLSRQGQVPSKTAVQRFADDLTTALLGRDITTIRASVLDKSISDLARGRGSTFVPATSLRETLTSCGIDAPTVQAIVRRFIDIGQEMRGPDDLPVRPKPRQP